jgi:putative membrane protein insertion efficiency factor
MGIISKLLIKLIGGYQKYVSPDHGWLKIYYPYGYCKYYPSCSEYAKQSIIKYGVVVGSLKSFVRIIKCNPLAKGGIDLP